MKKLFGLFLMSIILVFASQIDLDIVNPMSNIVQTELRPVIYPSPDETLKYDHNAFDNGIGIYSSTTPSTPADWQTYGFATYFLLHEFAITTPRKAKGVMVNFNSIPSATDFRLYIWRNVINPPGTLRPWSAFVTFPYCSLHVAIPPAQTWGYWDLSSYNVLIPDTVWVGVCYNEIATGQASWYLACEQAYSDAHTYINLQGGPGNWSPPTYANPYGVRLILERLDYDAGPVSINIADYVPYNWKVYPNVTVKNFGIDTATFDVTCQISPGGFTSVTSVANLAPGETTQVVFPDSFTFASGSYTVVTYTQLAGDVNPFNDTLEKVVEATGINEGETTAPRSLDLQVPTIIGSGRVQLGFALPKSTAVTLRVYDVMGRLARILISEEYSAGNHILDTDLDLVAGVYFLDLKTATDHLAKKFLIIE
jgi:hypothetical protein